jgi:hypothetical protein
MKDEAAKPRHTAAQSNPVKPNQTGSNPIKPGQTQSNRVKPNQIGSNPIKSGQTQSNRVKPNQTGSNPIKPGQTQSNRIKPNQTGSNPIKPDQTQSNRIKPSQTGSNLRGGWRVPKLDNPMGKEVGGQQPGQRRSNWSNSVKRNRATARRRRNNKRYARFAGCLALANSLRFRLRFQLRRENLTR